MLMTTSKLIVYFYLSLITITCDISRHSASQAGHTRLLGSSLPGVSVFLTAHHRCYSNSRIIVSHNLGSETKKATGIPIYMAIGQCGSVLGSHIYPSTEGPRYM